MFTLLYILGLKPIWYASASVVVWVSYLYLVLLCISSELCKCVWPRNFQ